MKLKLFLITALLSANAHAFTLNNSIGATFKMDKIPVDVNKAGCPESGMSADELMSIVEEAISQYWNKVPTSSLHLTKGKIKTLSNDFYDGPICETGTNCTPNDDLKVSENILISCNDNTATFAFMGTIGVSLPNHINGKDIKGALVLINDRTGAPFVTKARDEQVAIVAHEIGHAIGIGHSSVVDSLMYYQSVPTRRSLGSDDIDAATYLYPKEQPIDANCGAIMPMSNDNDGPGSGRLMFSLAALLALATLALKNIKKEL